MEEKMPAHVKIMGVLGLTAVLTLAACISTSVIASDISSADACKKTPKGAQAYRWAVGTAVAGGLSSGACIAGIVLMVVV